jgi:putative pyruvate formate lyase activating enzyme
VRLGDFYRYFENDGCKPQEECYIDAGILRCRLAMPKSFPSSPPKRPFQRSIPIYIRQPQPSRWLHLAPPFLLDRYTPRHHLISSIDAAKKRSEAYAHLRNCNLCPRLCGVNRYEKTGVCLIGAETVKVNTIAPHFGEGEACI